MMQKLSVALCFLTVLALLVGCSSTAHTGAADIRLDREASYFDDFTVQGETVLLRCVLQIENDGAEHEVTIKGFFPDDVGKLIEFDFQNGENCYSSVGHLYKHPAVGAYYAKKHGMSDTIVHAVLTHSRTVSPENDKAFNTPVSLIMKHMDELAYFYVAMHYPKPKAE